MLTNMQLDVNKHQHVSKPLAYIPKMGYIPINDRCNISVITSNHSFQNRYFWYLYLLPPILAVEVIELDPFVYQSVCLC